MIRSTGPAADRGVAVERERAPVLGGEPARAAGASACRRCRRRSRPPARSASRSPVPRTTTPSSQDLDERAQRAPRPASVERRCRRRAGSSGCGPARRTSRRAARRGGRSTCRPARELDPESPSAGSKRMLTAPSPLTRHAHARATGKPRPAISSCARRGLLVAADPQRDRRPGCCPREGERAMSAMLTPSRPSASAISAITPGLFGTDARSSCTGPPTSRRRAAPRGRARARSFHSPSAARRPRASQRADLLQALEQLVDACRRGRRGWTGRCRSRCACWRRRRGSRRGSSARRRAGRSACPRAEVSGGGLLDERVGEHVRQVRDARHQAVVGDRRRSPWGGAPRLASRRCRRSYRTPAVRAAGRRQVPGRAVEQVLAGVLDAGGLGAGERVAADEALVGAAPRRAGAWWSRRR